MWKRLLATSLVTGKTIEFYERVETESQGEIEQQIKRATMRRVLFGSRAAQAPTDYA